MLPGMTVINTCDFNQKAATLEISKHNQYILDLKAKGSKFYRFESKV